MRTLLEEFWYGNVNPQDQSTENNRKIERINLIGKNRNTLSAKLTNEQKETLSKYGDCLNNLYKLSSVKYSYVFRLGSRLTLKTIKRMILEESKLKIYAKSCGQYCAFSLSYKLQQFV